MGNTQIPNQSQTRGGIVPKIANLQSFAKVHEGIFAIVQVQFGLSDKSTSMDHH